MSAAPDSEATDKTNQAEHPSWWHRYRPSQAWWVATGVAASLFILFLANWAAYRRQPHRVAWSDYMQWHQYLMLCALASVICIMTYWLVRLWHEELPSADRSIEAAWQAGMKRLRYRGQDLEQVPLVLVLGGTTPQHPEQLLADGGVQLLEPIVPADPDAPLHWALTDQGVWLLIRAAGAYARLTQRLAMRQTSISEWPLEPSLVHDDVDADDHARDLPYAELYDSIESAVQAAPGTTSQVTAQQLTHQHTPQQAGHNQLSALGSIDAGSTNEVAVAIAQPPALSAVSAPSQCATDSTSQVASQVADQVVDELEQLIEQVDQAVETCHDTTSLSAQLEQVKRQRLRQTELAFQAAAEPHALSSIEISEGQRTLYEIGRRLRSARRSTAPANGVLVVLSTQCLLAGPAATSQAGLALRSDLQLLQDVWQLQSPVTLLIDGMERVEGTSELVRRGGAESARSDWSGAAFPITFQPEKRLLAHLCKVTFGQLESRIYRHLRARDSLTATGNHQLFKLLIACRSRLLPALQAFTCEALSLDVNSSPQSEPCICAGIHLVATGQKPTERAWVLAALAHVIQCQNYLRWTNARMQSEVRLQRLINLMRAICLVLTLTWLVTWFR